MNIQNNPVVSAGYVDERPDRLEKSAIDEQFYDIDEHFKKFKDTLTQFAESSLTKIWGKSKRP